MLQKITDPNSKTKWLDKKIEKNFKFFNLITGYKLEQAF